ncbi:DUF2637 domain-containing protein [Streptomyces anulatus]|uniref:DUF2637 domain-containing protein n=1 Tax=Streptomyces anulatus TaxID=1892 RepID=UPI0033E0FB21
MGARHGLRIDAVLIQAVIAGALSFAHLHDLASAAGQDGWKAWAYPVSVDLLLVAAWRRLRSDGPSRLAWCWFLIALFASLGANVATAGFLDLADPPAPLRLGIAGWPALAFLGGTLLAHSSGKPKPAPPAAVTETKDAGPARVPDAAPVPSQADEPPSTPSLSSPPDPSPDTPVPAVLIDHARKVADEYRSRTGSPIDTDTLRSRLGVPPHLADAIAARLS